jgi:hypothetical protein
LGCLLPGERSGSLFASFDQGGGGECLLHLLGGGCRVSRAEVEGSFGADVAHGAGVGADGGESGGHGFKDWHAEAFEG